MKEMLTNEQPKTPQERPLTSLVDKLALDLAALEEGQIPPDRKKEQINFMLKKLEEIKQQLEQHLNN